MLLAVRPKMVKAEVRCTDLIDLLMRLDSRDGRSGLRFTAEYQRRFKSGHGSFIAAAIGTTQIFRRAIKQPFEGSVLDTDKCRQKRT